VIDGLKPYPAMKDSGVPWLGEVPEHWEVRKVREVARVINGFPFDAARFSKLTGYPLIRIRDLDKAKTATCYEGPFVEAAKVESGDVLIGMDGDFNVGRWRGAEPALLNQRMCCLRSPDPVTESLLAYALPWPLKQINEVTWSTTVKHLASGQVERIQCSFPPLPEQAAIVRFLDHADRKIRRYIRAKQKLIKLLEEQKQVIIHRAVTRGLDPNVRLKASGVEWLGDVPEHWTLYRPKLLFRQVTLPKPANAEMVTCFRDGQVTLRRNRRTEGFTNAIKELGYQGIMAGQLVLHSMDAFAGAIGVSDSEGKCSPEYVICEPSSSGICVKYYALLLRSLALRGLFVVLCPSVRERAPRVRFSDFGSFELPKPPLREQEQVVDAIEAECSEVERSLQSEKRSVYLVGEYRIRLIADVVTGKLDVREAAAQLPDEDQELPPIDESDEISDAEEDGFDDLDEGTEEPEP